MPSKIERTNTETGDVPACSWFTPEFFEVAAPGAAPDEIWISTGVIDGAIGYTGITIGYSSEEVTIDGLTASRVESNPNPNEDPAYRRYWYVIPFDAEGAGPTFVACACRPRPHHGNAGVRPMTDVHRRAIVQRSASGHERRRPPIGRGSWSARSCSSPRSCSSWPSSPL